MLRRHIFLGTASLACAAYISGCGRGCASEDEEAQTKAAQAGPPTTVYIVRHAEKEEGKDPSLTEFGRRRALALPELLDVSSLAAIYSTATHRTKETAAPVAAISGLPVTRMPPRDFDGLVSRVEKHRGESILVVGHSNTVPEIIASLGVSEPVALADTDYGDLFVVVVGPGRPATLERHRFGDASAPE